MGIGEQKDNVYYDNFDPAGAVHGWTYDSRVHGWTYDSRKWTPSLAATNDDLVRIEQNKVLDKASAIFEEEYNVKEMSYEEENGFIKILVAGQVGKFGEQFSNMIYGTIWAVRGKDGRLSIKCHLNSITFTTISSNHVSYRGYWVNNSWSMHNESIRNC